jgi:antitoxin component YwqK of YwqJK toxin-antitoxin module
MSLIVSYDDVQEMGTDSGGDIIFYYQGKPLTGIIQEIVDGVLIGESEFTDGHVGGIQRFYYSNGKIQEEYTLHFNKLEGSYTLWDENGNVTGLSHWKNGVQIT